MRRNKPWQNLFLFVVFCWNWSLLLMHRMKWCLDCIGRGCGAACMYDLWEWVWYNGRLTTANEYFTPLLTRTSYTFIPMSTVASMAMQPQWLLTYLPAHGDAHIIYRCPYEHSLEPCKKFPKRMYSFFWAWPCICDASIYSSGAPPKQKITVAWAWPWPERALYQCKVEEVSGVMLACQQQAD